MSRIALVFSCLALLATGASAHAEQPAVTKVRLACAAVGIDPASPAFNQCVVDLDASLARVQSVAGR